MSDTYDLFSHQPVYTIVVIPGLSTAITIACGEVYHPIRSFHHLTDTSDMGDEELFRLKDFLRMVTVENNSYHPLSDKCSEQEISFQFWKIVSCIYKCGCRSECRREYLKGGNESGLGPVMGNQRPSVIVSCPDKVHLISARRSIKYGRTMLGRIHCPI